MPIDEGKHWHLKIDKCPENSDELYGEIIEVFNGDYIAKSLTSKLPAPNGNFLLWVCFLGLLKKDKIGAALSKD